MNHEEQSLIDGLFARLKQAENESAPRDAQAQARIAEHVQQHGAAPYYMAQAILVQEAAIKRLDEQNQQLQAELAQARASANAAPAQQGGGGFLSGLFGGGSRPAPAQHQLQSPPAYNPAAAQRPAGNGGGWREPSSSGFNAAPAQAARGGASSFLGGALQTAAGVAGGVMLAQGISSLFNEHSQPEPVAEAAPEAPAPASDYQDSYADTDYGDDGGGFGDDDSFV